MALFRSSSHLKRRSRWWWLIELSLVIAVIMGFRAWNQLSLAQGVAPAFEAEMLSGEAVQLLDYRGEPVLLYFWMLDCVSCRLQQATITDLAKNYSVLTIVSAEDTDLMLRYMQEHAISDWPTILDSSGELHKKFGVVAAPSFFIIDGEGQIRFREVGLTSSWGLQMRLWLAGSRNTEEVTP